MLSNTLLAIENDRNRDILVLTNKNCGMSKSITNNEKSILIKAANFVDFITTFGNNWHTFESYNIIFRIIKSAVLINMQLNHAIYHSREIEKSLNIIKAESSINSCRDYLILLSKIKDVNIDELIDQIDEIHELFYKIK